MTALDASIVHILATLIRGDEQQPARVAVGPAEPRHEP